MQTQKILATKEIRFGMKNIIFIIGALLVASVCLNLFSVGKIKEQTKIIKQKETENSQLKQVLFKQKELTFALQKRNEELIKQWEETPKEKIIEKIKIKNNEKYIHYLNSELSEQLRIFAENLEQERAHYDHRQRHDYSDNSQ